VAFSASSRHGLLRLIAWILIAGGLGFLSPTRAAAHVGSPDIYADGNAGPYRVFVTIRPPLVIPGVAEIEVRTVAGGPAVPVSRLRPFR
jgi:hypothetical protein